MDEVSQPPPSQAEQLAAHTPRAKRRRGRVESPSWEVTLRDRRLKLGLSLADVADPNDVSVTHLAAIETGRHEPSLRLAYRLAKFFGVPIEDLWVRPNDRKSRGKKSE